MRLRQGVLAGLVLVALALCGWFEAAMAPFGVASSVVTFSVGAVVIVLGAARGFRATTAARERPEVAAESSDTSLRGRGLTAWMLAAALVLAVELWELFHSPRHLYPTLSSIANEVVGPGHRVGRTVAFVLWGVCGLLIMTKAPRRQ